MNYEEIGPARVGARDGAGCCYFRGSSTTPQPCSLAPLCPRIRVAVGSAEGQTFELGWAQKTGKGLLVALHVHEADVESFQIDLPLGLLLRLWTEPNTPSEAHWWDSRSQKTRRSRIELTNDGSLLLSCKAPDAGVFVPSGLVQDFKFALGILLRLADKTVGILAANLTEVGGSMSRARLCAICTGEFTCRASKLGIVLCATTSDHALGKTQSGLFIFVDGVAAERVRLAEGRRGCT